MKFQKGVGANPKLTYPLTRRQIRRLYKSRLVNPMKGKSYGTVIPKFDEKEEALKVKKATEQVKNSEFPLWVLKENHPFTWDCHTELTPVLKLAGFDKSRPIELAKAVHMDLTIDLARYKQQWLLSNGYNVKAWSPNYVNFLESVPDPLYEVAKYQSKYARIVFKNKWYHGVPRPEEVLGENFTIYPEGCPCHAESGQGHIWFALLSTMALAKKFNLPDHIVEMLLETDYQWGQFRVFAGVHYGFASVVSIMLSKFTRKFVCKSVLNQYYKPTLIQKVFNYFRI